MICLLAVLLASAHFLIPGVEGSVLRTDLRQHYNSLKADWIGSSITKRWLDYMTIDTDFDQDFPSTGRNVTYNLEITNTTCNPDGGFERTCMLVNGQYPGPTLRANWGDRMIVNVKNSMQDNGTTIHFHGVRQYHTPGADGVPGLTECPLAPGRSKTYIFDVTQHGTSWYHSHYSSQYGDGIVGAIVFEGPATANYDVDLGPYPVNEWYYRTAWQQQDRATVAIQSTQPATPADNQLVNGTNVAANGAGRYNQVFLEKGKRYRLRIISMAVDNYMRVSLDNHMLEIIAADFVPIKPIRVEWLAINVGQRYDVIVTANQSAGNYWFRTEAAKECRNNNLRYGRAIWTYSTVPAATPNSTAFAEPTDCLEPGPLTPHWYQPVPSGTFKENLQNLAVNLTHAVVVPGGDSIVVWALGRNIDVDWNFPTLSYVLEGNDTGPFPSNINLVHTESEGSWNYWLIQQTPGLPPIPHPIHLHGHDFFVLGQGNSSFDAAVDVLNFETPTRRDTASIYGNGWLAIAFQSNNPGTWLMHCHIAWHVSEGMGVQFLEAPSQISLPDKQQYDAQCAAWDSYYATAYYRKTDSGV